MGVWTVLPSNPAIQTKEKPFFSPSLLVISTLFSLVVIKLWDSVTVSGRRNVKQFFKMLIFNNVSFNYITKRNLFIQRDNSLLVA